MLDHHDAQPLILKPEPKQGLPGTNNERGSAAFAIRNAQTLPDVVRLTALGYSPRAIAEITKRDVHTIYKLMREPEFVESLDRLREVADRRATEFRERLAIASESALDRIIQISEGGNTEYVKLSANKYLVDSAGMTAQTSRLPQGGSPVNVFNFDPAAFERVIEALREVAGRPTGGGPVNG